MGVLTGIEILGIAGMLLALSWMFVRSAVPQFYLIDAAAADKLMSPADIGVKKWQLKLLASSAILGRLIPFPMALLFLPVTRGSPILRMVDVPFEQAVKYHRWLGHLTMLLVSAHGITYAIFAGSINSVYLLGEWKDNGISNLAGVIAMLAGTVMWVTSVPLMRKRFFNVFYSMHHLYLVYFAFSVWHVGWSQAGEFLGAIFLFFVDRFLRFVQSRRPVTGVSARLLPSGVIELSIPTHAGFRHNALSFMFLNIPGVSRIEWHPFSTTSSPLDGSSQMSVCIKPIGDWSLSLLTKLFSSSSAAPKSAQTSRTQISSSEKSATMSCPFAIGHLFAEGPYGHESNYFLRYRYLLLIGGGVGITPFLAILRDLLKRHELRQAGLPIDVQLIWCVRRRSELEVLSEIRCPSKLQPVLPGDYGAGIGIRDTQLSITVKGFITERSKEQPDGSNNSSTEAAVCQSDNTILIESPLAIKSECHASKSSHNNLSLSPVIPSKNPWMAAVIFASATGFVLISGLFHLYVVTPSICCSSDSSSRSSSSISSKNGGSSTKPNFPTALEVFLLFVSMFVGIVICGGGVILAWSKKQGYKQNALPCTAASALTMQMSKPAATNNREAAIAATRMNIQETAALDLVDVEANAVCEESLLDQCTIAQGTRPDFSEIFNGAAVKYQGEDVGVLVSGPEGLKASVAAECRRQNFTKPSWSNSTHFHFHSISFNL